MTALDVLTRVERHGGELAVNADGVLVLRKPRGVPANLRDDIRRYKREIRAAILARTGVAQLTLDLPASPPPVPASFLDAQEAKFDALLREFGVAVDAPKQFARRSA